MNIEYNKNLVKTSFTMDSKEIDENIANLLMNLVEDN